MAAGHLLAVRDVAVYRKDGAGGEHQQPVSKVQHD
jgi:hypothetical protein